MHVFTILSKEKEHHLQSAHLSYTSVEAYMLMILDDKTPNSSNI